MSVSVGVCVGVCVYVRVRVRVCICVRRRCGDGHVRSCRLPEGEKKEKFALKLPPLKEKKLRKKLPEYVFWLSGSVFWLSCSELRVQGSGLRAQEFGSRVRSNAVGKSSGSVVVCTGLSRTQY